MDRCSLPRAVGMAGNRFEQVRDGVYVAAREDLRQFVDWHPQFHGAALKRLKSFVHDTNRRDKGPAKIENIAVLRNWNERTATRVGPCNMGTLNINRIDCDWVVIVNDNAQRLLLRASLEQAPFAAVQSVAVRPKQGYLYNRVALADVLA